jgi:5-methylthioadenosine/S-adenosylhomocysteine deaminase
MDEARSVFMPGAIAIAGRDIVAVGPERDLRNEYEGTRSIDAEGAIVHPGFVDAHYHATMHTSRGVLEGLFGAPGGVARASFGVFSRWMNLLEAEDEFASAQLACLEMVRNGVTCFLDPGTAFEPDAVAEAARGVGVRASLADPFVWDVEGGLRMASEIERAPAKRSRALRILGSELRRNRDPDSLVVGHVGLYGSGSASEELEIAAKECADRAGVVLTQHQCLDSADAAFDRARFGADPLVHLRRLGVLGENCAFMHMNALSDADVDAVRSSNMTVVWHPGNFLYYGISASGPSPAVELARSSARVALGADIAKAWTFTETSLIGYLVARMQGVELPADTLLALMTRNGAQAVGLSSRIGTLEPGKRADLVVRRDDLPEAQPGIDPVRQLALISKTKSVRTVLVDGRVVVDDGRATTVDEAEVYEAARRSALRLGAQMGVVGASSARS